MNFVFRVGVPCAIALFLVYRLTVTLDERLDRMGGYIQEQRALQQTIHAQMQVHMDNSSIAIHLARQLCVNTAKSPEQEQSCWKTSP